MDFDEPLISRLTAGGAAARMNLDSFVAQLDLLPYLEANPSQHFNWLGHPTLICKIHAGLWQTEPLTETRDGRLVFPDPTRHFDVHFELQVQLWKGRMALYLHYETNRYFSEAKLRAKADSTSLEQYYKRRNDFIQELIALGEAPGFKLSPGTVQVGKAVYDFDGKRQKEVASWLQPVIDEVACRVNEALHRVDQRRHSVEMTGAGVVPVITTCTITDSVQT